jgi:hypothetical protein
VIRLSLSGIPLLCLCANLSPSSCLKKGDCSQGRSLSRIITLADERTHPGAETLAVSLNREPWCMRHNACKSCRLAAACGAREGFLGEPCLRAYKEEAFNHRHLGTVWAPWKHRKFTYPP